MDQPILTSRQSKAAREQLGMSQRRAAADSGLQRLTLNQFETRKVVPNDAFLEELRDFYESRGAVIEDAAPVESKPGQVEAVALPDRYVLDGFVVTGAMAQDEADQILEELALVEEKIEDIMVEPLEERFLFEGVTDRCERRQEEMQILMVRAYSLIRKLQGRSSVDPCGKRDSDDGLPADHAGLLGGIFSDWWGVTVDDQDNAA